MPDTPSSRAGRQGRGAPLDKGLLPRSGVHTLFDRGYLGVDPQRRLLVSPRLRADFSNGDQFYAKAVQIIDLPEHGPPGRAGSSWSGTSTRSSSRRPRPDRR